MFNSSTKRHIRCAEKGIDFAVECRLGRGSFGSVYKVSRLSDGYIAVVKKIDLDGLSSLETKAALREVEILQDLDSEFIVPYKNSFVDDNHLCIVMGYCENGDLQQYLAARKGMVLTEAQIWSFFIQALLGLHHIHSQRILHRDFKSANVFLAEESRTLGYRLQIGDLGVARVLGSQSNFAKTIVGTPYYLSPELCEDQPYNEKSDIWALGVVLYECATLRRPFNAKNQFALIHRIVTGRFESVTGYSVKLCQLVDLLLRRNCARRPDTTAILQLPVVRERAEELGFVVPVDVASPASASWRGSMRSTLSSSSARNGNSRSSRRPASSKTARSSRGSERAAVAPAAGAGAAAAAASSSASVSAEVPARPRSAAAAAAAAATALAADDDGERTLVVKARTRVPSTKVASSKVARLARTSAARTRRSAAAAAEAASSKESSSPMSSTSPPRAPRRATAATSSKDADAPALRQSAWDDTVASTSSISSASDARFAAAAAEAAAADAAFAALLSPDNDDRPPTPRIARRVASKVQQGEKEKGQGKSVNVKAKGTAAGGEKKTKQKSAARRRGSGGGKRKVRKPSDGGASGTTSATSPMVVSARRLQSGGSKPPSSTPPDASSSSSAARRAARPKGQLLSGPRHGRSARGAAHTQQQRQRSNDAAAAAAAALRVDGAEVAGRGGGADGEVEEVTSGGSGSGSGGPKKVASRGAARRGVKVRTKHKPTIDDLYALRIGGAEDEAPAARGAGGGSGAERCGAGRLADHSSAQLSRTMGSLQVVGSAAAAGSAKVEEEEAVADGVRMTVTGDMNDVPDWGASSAAASDVASDAASDANDAASDGDGGEEEEEEEDSGERTMQMDDGGWRRSSVEWDVTDEDGDAAWEDLIRERSGSAGSHGDGADVDSEQERREREEWLTRWREEQAEASLSRSETLRLAVEEKRERCQHLLGGSLALLRDSIATLMEGEDQSAAAFDELVASLVRHFAADDNVEGSSGAPEAHAAALADASRAAQAIWSYVMVKASYDAETEKRRERESRS